MPRRPIPLVAWIVAALPIGLMAWAAVIWWLFI